MIPTYRPGRYLLETLRSLSQARQTYGRPMQVQIVDDASPECDVAQMIAGWGFLDVEVHRRDVNGGLAECWNTCIARARGEWLHILHQDDLVSPDYYSRMEELVSCHPDVGMAFCRNYVLIRENLVVCDLIQEHDSIIENWLQRISAGQLLQCPAACVRRSVYDQVGGFDSSLRFIVDWEMWIRIAASFKVAYVSEPLVTYRVHEQAETVRLWEGGEVLPDFINGLIKIRKTLLEADRVDCVQAALEYGWDTFGHAAVLQQQGRRADRAWRYLITSIRHFGRDIGAKKVLWRLRWALSLAIESIRQRHVV